MHSVRVALRRPLPGRPAVVWALAAALVAGGTGGRLVFPEGGGGERGGVVRLPRAPERVRDGLDLPWPKEGQAAVAVEKVGVLGAEGTSRPVPIASVTKVMTAYVVLKGHPLDAGEDGPLIKVDERAAAEAHSSSESTAPLDAGRRLSQRKLLELMLLPSANNVARLLARRDAGSWP
ncbi:hypothetical protein ACOBQB_01315 [Streptomyces sp. G5(2025)]|uniref:hypothetical protein n=1 Tax=Streptomyces sp. G5(2025) TaxID=3406628 RepID=UPI003C27ADF4